MTKGPYVSEKAGSLDFRPAAAWAAAYGPMPDTYLTFDIESSGLDHGADHILQLGWCVVKDRLAAANAAVVVDWTAVLSPDQLAALSDRLEETRRSMEARGDDYPWTLAMMRGRGVTPRKAVADMRALAPVPPAYVAHNGWGFDYPFFGRSAEAVGTGPWEPPVHALWDTALLVKACQTGLTPRADEQLPAFVRRLHDARPRGRYSLGACVDLFGLRAMGVNPKASHDASYDSWLVHLVFECVRRGIEALK